MSANNDNTRTMSGRALLNSSEAAGSPAYLPALSEVGTRIKVGLVHDAVLGHEAGVTAYEGILVEVDAPKREMDEGGVAGGVPATVPAATVPTDLSPVSELCLCSVCLNVLVSAVTMVPCGTLYAPLAPRRWHVVLSVAKEYLLRFPVEPLIRLLAAL
jgi:hypothetical protein